MTRKNVVLLFLFMLISACSFGAAKLTIYSYIKSDLYVNGVKQASLNKSDPFILQINEPGKYRLELRAIDKNLTYSEEVNLLPETDFDKTIRAFEEVETAKNLESSKNNGDSVVTKSEMEAEISKAKAEALAEEEARRKRDKEREAGKKAVIHLLGVETQDVPSEVKNMERIKLLGEVLPELDE